MNLIHPDEQKTTYRAASHSYGAPQNHLPSASRPYIASALDNSCYNDGLLLASQPGDVDGTDYVLCLSPDLTRIGSIGQLNLPPQQPQPQYNLATGQYQGSTGSNRPPLTEQASILTIHGRTWSMATMNTPPIPSPSGTPVPAVINELAAQFLEHTKQFMLLTNVGLTFLVKRRAVDYLRAVLEDLQAEGNVQPIIEFRDRLVNLWVHESWDLTHK